MLTGMTERGFSLTGVPRASHNYLTQTMPTYDPDVSVSQLWIDKEVINGKVCLTFVDNGKGMDLDYLLPSDPLTNQLAS